MPTEKQLPYDAKVIMEDPTCMNCGRLCEKNEIVWTGDMESYEGFELWCYCKDCDVETFHKLVKA